MTSRRSPNRNNREEEKEGNLPTIWQRAFTAKSPWPEKDDFLDVIYWSRQIIGILLGIVWGIVPLKGFIGLALFCAINAGVLYIYFTSFQQIDEEDFGGIWELTKEGFMSSFALFLVVWIIIYSALYFD